MDTETKQPEPLLVDLRTAGVMLGVSRETLYRMISRGEISTVRIGTKIRIRRETLDELIDRCTVTAGAAP